jgi:hypothetical protein
VRAAALKAKATITLPLHCHALETGLLERRRMLSRALRVSQVVMWHALCCRMLRTGQMVRRISKEEGVRA